MSIIYLTHRKSPAIIWQKWRSTVLMLDHFVLGVHDLQSGITGFSNLAGITPLPSGQHPTVGTHNALVSLDKDLYFELLAPDLSLRRREDVGIERLRTLTTPLLISWMLSCSDFSKLDEVCKKVGLAFSTVGSGSRITLDGNELQYEFSRPTFESVPDFASPWVIRWLSCPHPSLTSPLGCKLNSFSIRCPPHAQFREFTKLLAAPIRVIESDKWQIEVKLDCPKGVVQWAGPEE